MSALIPPDYERCQCEVSPAHGAFRLGPRPAPARCDKLPTFLAVELVAGADGERGSMCLCTDCAKVMLDDSGLRARVQLQPILRDAAPGVGS